MLDRNLPYDQFIRLRLGFNVMMSQPIIPLLTGPTGVGKTAYSIELAKRVNAEIVSVDSRQVYKELTIGTAKPGRDDLASVPHHFISERSLSETYSSGEFARDANSRIADILARNRKPLVTGGSTLYFHALVCGLAPTPEPQLGIRKNLQQRLSDEGIASLYECLRSIDPVTAKNLDVANSSRIIRALEVWYATGVPLSHYHVQHEPPAFEYRIVVLDRDRASLYRRINDRVDHMVESGLIEEVRSLITFGHEGLLQSLRTIGYTETIDYLKGHTDYAEMIRLIKRNTRRYAKRQLTWFRRYKDATWVYLDPCCPNSMERDVSRIQAALTQPK